LFPVTVLAHGLATLLIFPDRAAEPAAWQREAEKTANESGYRWLAFQFRSLRRPSGESSPVPSGEWLSLGRFFRRDDEWRRGLLALEHLAVKSDPAPAARHKRLAWAVRHLDHPRNSFAPVQIYPVEQTLGRGGWTKGRNISLRRIFQRSGDLSFASDQDRRAFGALRAECNGFGSGLFFNDSELMFALIGHPLIFRADSDGSRVDVEEGRFELAASESGGGCHIALEPSLSEFSSGAGDVLLDRGSDAFPDGFPKAIMKWETPGRIRVYRLEERELRLAKIVGDGLDIPSAGREEAVRVLSRLSELVKIQSDLPELASAGELIKADPIPRFHLVPRNPGLGVEIWSHPFGTDGPAWRPGRGGRIIAGTVDGRTLRTVRDLALERKKLAEATAACPSLADGETAYTWYLENPEAALSFLAETEDLADKAMLVWPKGGAFRVRKCFRRGGLTLRLRSRNDWFEIEGDLKVDENLVVDMKQLLESCRRHSGKFVELDNGDYIALTDELRRQLGDLDALGEIRDGKLRLPSLAGGILEGLEEAGADLIADASWKRDLERRKNRVDFSPDPPTNFLAVLRDYQLDGYRWLARLAEWGAGACLADDMGLGKTIQALAILVRRAGLGPALVVAPTSVCPNWLSETARFAPTLRMAVLKETNRETQIAGLGPGDALIASYSLLRQAEKNLSGIKWATAVLDEAQAIKNFATRRSRAAMSLDAGFRLITTGTPIENRLSELWNLFHFINPSLLGTIRRFTERFAQPIERRKDAEAAERLRRVIRPFVLRRTKNQVLSSLPPKTEITLSIELDERERAFYESLRRNALDRLERGKGDESGRRSLMILAEIMRLRRACCTPELVDPASGITSAKQEQFRATLAEIIENQHKALVFSQFVDHLSIIRRHLDAAGYTYQYLDGSTPAKQRKKAVDDFQEGKGDIFLLSLKAGGLGLNLTAADYVIHMDPWWNPAVEDQASDRAHRIGQEKPVTVYRLVAAGTIEEKIVRLHQDKRELADNLLAGSDQSAILDMDEMMRLIRED
jgi:superfamily II DNA or RNA helicase